MAREAGLNVGSAKIVEGINNREVLLLERFDINNRYRHHLITINALLKEQANQCDRGGAFRYEDIADIVCKYSLTPQRNLEHLLRQMLFNAAINNMDDHERNFSLLGSSEGYTLSPAYDMVPSISVGDYHVAGFKYRSTPPYPSEIHKEGRVFGLKKTVVNEIAEKVIHAVDNSEHFATSAGVSPDDFDQVNRMIQR